jgi:tRNA dimethylallyltransferase
LAKLDRQINKRVLARANKHMSNEVLVLINKYPKWNTPAFTATGYQEWRQYIKNEATRSQAITLWQQRERQYARRQITWFKKQAQVNWFSAQDKNAFKAIEKRVKNWYA